MDVLFEDAHVLSSNKAYSATIAHCRRLETIALLSDGCFIRPNKAEKFEIQFHSVILAMMADLQISVLIVM